MIRRKKFFLKGYHCYGEGNKTSIGLVGTHRGVGATHTCIMIATFLGKLMDGKTAYLEMNTHHDLQRLQEHYVDDVKKEKEFYLNKIMFYKNVKEEELAVILNQDFDYFIIDFGEAREEMKNEFLRCDKKIVVASLAEWKKSELQAFVRRHERLSGHRSWQYCMPFGSEKEMKKVNREYKISAKVIGYEQNPFRLSEKNVEVIHSIL